MYLFTYLLLYKNADLNLFSLILLHKHYTGHFYTTLIDNFTNNKLPQNNNIRL